MPRGKVSTGPPLVIPLSVPQRRPTPKKKRPKRTATQRGGAPTTSGLLPTSGYEPAFNPRKWCKSASIKRTHNCYSYVMNDLNPKHSSKAQPGYSNSATPELYGRITCPAVFARMRVDNPQVLYDYPKDRACPAHYYKGALVTDPQNDYHFLRQDPDGLWSHKPGTGDVSRTDASGRPISDPDTADMMYGAHQPGGCKGGGLCYNQHCGYFCVPDKYTQTLSEHVLRGRKKVVVPSGTNKKTATKPPKRNKPSTNSTR